MTEVSLNQVLNNLRTIFSFNLQDYSGKKWVVQKLEEISEELFKIGCSEKIDSNRGLMILTLKSYVVQMANSIKENRIFIPRYLIDGSNILIKNLYCR